MQVWVVGLFEIKVAAFIQIFSDDDGIVRLGKQGVKWIRATFCSEKANYDWSGLSE